MTRELAAVILIAAGILAGLAGAFEAGAFLAFAALIVAVAAPDDLHRDARQRNNR